MTEKGRSTHSLAVGPIIRECQPLNVRKRIRSGQTDVDPRMTAKAELQPSGLPVNAVPLICFAMTTIVVHVKILTGGRERRMPEVVTHEP